jgi:hypothetical protein
MNAGLTTRRFLLENEMARPKKEDGDEKPVEVRILCDHWREGVLLQCNTVFECDAQTAKELVRDGLADDNADAVKAARA